MDINLVTAWIGIAAGALGYVKHQVLMDPFYYAQVVNPENLNDEMKNSTEYEQAAGVQTSIRRKLGLPSET